MKHKHTKHGKKNHKNKSKHKRSAHKKKLKNKLPKRDKIAQLEADHLFEVQKLKTEHILDQGSEENMKTRGVLYEATNPNYLKTEIEIVGRENMTDSSLLLEPSSGNEISSSSTPTHEDRERIYAEILELELRAEAIRSILKRELEDVEQIDADSSDQFDDLLKGNQSSINFHVIKDVVVNKTGTENLKRDLKPMSSQCKAKEGKNVFPSPDNNNLSKEPCNGIKDSADCKQKSTSANDNNYVMKLPKCHNGNDEALDETKQQIIDKHSNEKDMPNNVFCDQNTNQNIDKLMKIKYLSRMKPKSTSANIFEETITGDNIEKFHETKGIQTPSQCKWSDKNLQKIIATSKMCSKLRKKMQTIKQLMKKLE